MFMLPTPQDFSIAHVPKHAHLLVFLSCGVLMSFIVSNDVEQPTQQKYRPDPATNSKQQVH
jgi:hypothetical protein